jgi:hypothetical protein
VEKSRLVVPAFLMTKLPLACLDGVAEVVTSSAVNGDVTVGNGRLAYRPRPNFLGVDTFTVVATGGGVRARAVYELTVVPAGTRSYVRAGRRGRIKSCGVRKSRACTLPMGVPAQLSVRVGPSPVTSLRGARVRITYYRLVSGRYVATRHARIKLTSSRRWKSFAFAPTHRGRWAVRIGTPTTRYSRASRSRFLYLSVR